MDEAKSVFGNFSSGSKSNAVLPMAILWFFVAAFMAFLVFQDSIPYETLLLDPKLAAATPWYAGLLWGFSLLGWTAAAVSAFTSAWICRLAGRNRVSGMLFRGGVLSMLFLLEDLFQIGHRLGSIFNIPEVTFTVACILASAAWAVAERSELQRTRVELVGTSIAALFCALLMLTVAPTVFGVDQERALIAASAAKFLGVLAWAQYFLLTGADIVRSILVNLRAKPSSSNPKQVDLGQPPGGTTLTRRETPIQPAS